MGLSASNTRRAPAENLPSASRRSAQCGATPLDHLAGAASGSGVRKAINNPHRILLPGLRLPT